MRHQTGKAHHIDTAVVMRGSMHICQTSYILLCTLRIHLCLDFNMRFREDLAQRLYLPILCSVIRGRTSHSPTAQSTGEAPSYHSALQLPQELETHWAEGWDGHTAPAHGSPLQCSKGMPGGHAGDKRGGREVRVLPGQGIPTGFLAIALHPSYV